MNVLKKPLARAIMNKYLSFNPLTALVVSLILQVKRMTKLTNMGTRHLVKQGKNLLLKQILPGERHIISLPT